MSATRKTFASHVLIRALMAVFTALVLLLAQSVFWSPGVSAWMRVVIIAIMLLSYFRPHYGLLALAALAPLGQVVSRTLDSNMRGAEALVLAFLAGALVRGWTLREFRTFPSSRLETAAAIFGVVVAASFAEQIWFMQIRRDFPWSFAQEVLTYASRDYLTGLQGFGMLSDAMVLMEGMALLLYAARYATASAEYTRRLVVMLALGAIAPALLTVVTAADGFAQTTGGIASLMDFFSRGRWVGHIGDINAAGSYFAMTAFLTFGMGFHDREWRLAWLVVGAGLFLTMLLTGSRTAVAASGLVGVLILVRLSTSHSRYRVRAFSRVGVVLAGATALFFVFRTTGGTPSEAMSVRWSFLQATAAMLREEPVFGVGIGQYSARSAHFAPAALFKVWRPDNAHNNLAQIAGELGLLGLLIFLIVLTAALGFRSGIPGANPSKWPVLAGLAAFILTWLGGHPLLVPEVAYPFWLALGAAASCVIVPSKGNFSSGIAGIGATLLLLSIPFRVGVKTADLDFARVRYGVSPHQLISSRARFFVPAAERRVEFPVRARGASDDGPIQIDVMVDGSASGAITLRDPDWHKAPIVLPMTSRRFHQIDLQIRHDPIGDIDAGRSTVEVGEWEIISKPNG